MKYQHNFAIRHLPFTILSVVTFIIAVVTTFSVFLGWWNGPAIVFGVVLMLSGFVVSGVSITFGVEYTSKLAPEPVDPPTPTRRAITREEIDERRDEVLNMDFEPSQQEIEAAARNSEKQRHAKLAKNLLS